MEKIYHSIAEVKDDKEKKHNNVYSLAITNSIKFLEMLKGKVSIENYHFRVNKRKLEVVIDGIDGSYVSFTFGKNRVFETCYQSVHGDTFYSYCTLDMLDYKIFTYLELSGLRRKR